MKAGVRDIVVLDAGPVPGEGREERKSGSSVMELAGTIKMMVQVFASSCDHFIAHHGEKGARKYLSLTAEGLRIKGIGHGGFASPARAAFGTGIFLHCL
jgi:hypothetical protein